MPEEAKKTKVKSKEYPAITLKKAINFIEKLKDYPVGKPISYELAAKEMGVSVTTKSFKYTISAARQFGLISTSSGSTLSFLAPANRFARPTEDESVLSLLKLQCFSTPKIYEELISEHKGKSIPDITKLENILVSYHGVAPNAATIAAKTFIDSADEAGAIKSGVLSFDLDAPTESLTEAPNEDRKEQREQMSITQSFQSDLVVKEGFDAPLSIPFGEQKNALLYMPLNTEKDDAEYALAMIKLMFKKVYGVASE